MSGCSAAADELFYAEGVQTVGIDRVVERAGVAKASLYNTFGSKENLVQAYLEGRHRATVDLLRRDIERHTDPGFGCWRCSTPRPKIFADPNFHGCAFIGASAEAPDGGLIQQAADQYRNEIRGLLTDLARDAGAAEPAVLARQLQLLFDGGGLAAQLDRDPDVAAASRAAAVTLLDAATR